MGIGCLVLEQNFVFSLHIFLSILLKQKKSLIVKLESVSYNNKIDLICFEQLSRFLEIKILSIFCLDRFDLSKITSAKKYFHIMATRTLPQPCHHYGRLPCAKRQSKSDDIYLKFKDRHNWSIWSKGVFRIFILFSNTQ